MDNNQKNLSDAAAMAQFRLALIAPNHDVGCELSSFSDIFWNEERLSRLMRKVDAVTVAAVLPYLSALASKQQET